MSFFKDIEGEGAIVVVGGVHKQVTLATRNGYLFAKVAGGYVRLMEDGSTSKAGLRLDYMTFEGDLYRDGLGKLCTSEVSGARALDAPKAQKLLGAS